MFKWLTRVSLVLKGFLFFTYKHAIFLLSKKNFIKGSFMYEIQVSLQTPLDPNKFYVGSYIINSIIQLSSEFIESNYKKMIVKENPFIFANDWSEFISDRFIYVSFYKEMINIESSDLESIYFLLTNFSKYKWIYKFYFLFILIFNISK